MIYTEDNIIGKFLETDNKNIYLIYKIETMNKYKELKCLNLKTCNEIVLALDGTITLINSKFWNVL